MIERDIRKRFVELARRGDFLIQPIESGATGIGIFDSFFRTHKRDGWLEFKIGIEHKSGAITVPWRAGQRAWLNRYVKLGGRALLVLGLDLNAVYVISGRDARDEYPNFTCLAEDCVACRFLHELDANDLEYVLDL